MNTIVKFSSLIIFFYAFTLISCQSPLLVKKGGYELIAASFVYGDSTLYSPESYDSALGMLPKNMELDSQSIEDSMPPSEMPWEDDEKFSQEILFGQTDYSLPITVSPLDFEGKTVFSIQKNSGDNPSENSTSLTKGIQKKRKSISRKKFKKNKKRKVAKAGIQEVTSQVGSDIFFVLNVEESFLNKHKRVRKTWYKDRVIPALQKVCNSTEINVLVKYVCSSFATFVKEMTNENFTDKKWHSFRGYVELLKKLSSGGKLHPNCLALLKLEDNNTIFHHFIFPSTNKMKNTQSIFGDLIKLGISINEQNNDGKTPLHIILDPHLVDRLDNNSLSKYINQERLYYRAKIYVECGANPQTFDAEGNTPLHCFLKKELFCSNGTAIKRLFEQIKKKNIDPFSIKNKKGKSIEDKMKLNNKQIFDKLVGLKKSWDNHGS